MLVFKKVLALSVLSLLALFGTAVGKRTKQDLEQIPNKLRLEDGRELVPVVIVEGKEYFVDSGYRNISWTDAVAYCDAFNMTIGETVTAHQYQQVYLFVPLFYNFWLGGTNAFPGTSEWFWRTDRVLFNYTRWGATQPNNRNSCMYFIEELQIWWTIDCLDHTGEPEEIYVLCQRPVVSK
ncbi:uncharacterized protein LOC110855320 [Folsomia candida]|uniref:C-type lectin domain-containing protein n=1 Tax=Folsomia candida TaxID=158441 RepID=A0A226DTP1_FOLCA|nr:uncharacterized protein LOC110855320 [Folsomia candida]OXA48067.1 hypothetical protein Fcan01_16910 [Folsomia candida]